MYPEALRDLKYKMENNADQELYKQCEAKVKEIVYKEGLNGINTVRVVAEITALLVEKEKEITLLKKHVYESDWPFRKS